MKAKRPPIEHGTYAGYQWHKRQRATPCAPCKAALAAYMKEKRADPEYRRRQAACITAERQAKSELMRRYPDEYRRLYARFLDESGVNREAS